MVQAVELGFLHLGLFRLVFFQGRRLTVACGIQGLVVLFQLALDLVVSLPLCLAKVGLVDTGEGLAHPLVLLEGIGIEVGGLLCSLPPTESEV